MCATQGDGQFIPIADAQFDFDSITRKGADDFFEAFTTGGVESGHRVIEDEFFRAFEESASEEDAAHFAVGKRDEGARQKVFEFKQARYFFEAFAPGAAFGAAVDADFERTNVKHLIEG